MVKENNGHPTWFLQSCVCVLAVLLGLSTAMTSADSGQPVEVTTPYGDLRGIRTPFSSINNDVHCATSCHINDDLYVDKFLAIPYAKPPVGEC